MFGTAVATEAGTRRVVGVAAQGMTACPCAQQLVAGRARERLADDGFDDGQIERIFDAVPVATHNQRGLGTLHVGCPEDCVREMIRGVVDGLPDLDDRAFVSARQENLETIHQHNVVAERFGVLGELRRELDSGEHAPHHTSMRDWLDGRA